MNYEEIHTDANDKQLRSILQNLGEKEPQETITINSRADIFKIIAIIIAAVGIIAGIICGFVFPSTEIVQKSIYLSPKAEEVFNAGIMFAVWLGTAFSTISYWAIYCILDSMDNMLIELKRANRYHKQNANEE